MLKHRPPGNRNPAAGEIVAVAGLLPVAIGGLLSGPIVDRLACRASFLELAGKGTLREAKLLAKIDQTADTALAGEGMAGGLTAALQTGIGQTTAADLGLEVSQADASIELFLRLYSGPLVSGMAGELRQEATVLVEMTRALRRTRLGRQQVLDARPDVGAGCFGLLQFGDRHQALRVARKEEHRGERRDQDDADDGHPRPVDAMLDARILDDRREALLLHRCRYAEYQERGCGGDDPPRRPTRARGAPPHEPPSRPGSRRPRAKLVAAASFS